MRINLAFWLFKNAIANKQFASMARLGIFQRALGERINSLGIGVGVLKVFGTFVIGSE